MRALHYIRGQRNALTSLGLHKEAKEFAPGIPASRPTSPLPTIARERPAQWHLITQEHNAKRAKKHVDLRLVDTDAGKAHSWAVPKAKLPAPGEKLLAIQTFTHTPQYALHFGERKTETIGKGYGAGTVRITLKTPTTILQSSPDKVRFTGKDLNEYLLRRTRDKSWLLTNTTKQ